MNPTTEHTEHTEAAAPASPPPSIPSPSAAMKTPDPKTLLGMFRIGGRVWFWAMMAWFWFGSVTCAPGSRAEIVADVVSLAAFVLWLLASAALLAAWIVALRAEPTGELAVIRDSMSRWLAAMGGGLLGGLAAAGIADVLFVESERLDAIVLGSMIGLLAGPAALLFRRRPAITALAAIPFGFILAAVFLSVFGLL